MKYAYGKKGFGDQLKIKELIRIPGIGVSTCFGNGNIPEMEWALQLFI